MVYYLRSMLMTRPDESVNFTADWRQYWSDRDGTSTAAYIEPDSWPHHIYCLTTVHTTQNELRSVPVTSKQFCFKRLMQHQCADSATFVFESTKLCWQRNVCLWKHKVMLTAQRLSLKARSYADSATFVFESTKLCWQRNVCLWKHKVMLTAQRLSLKAQSIWNSL
jgi:hypothetical protein